MLIKIKWDRTGGENMPRESLTCLRMMMKPFILKTANEFDTEQGPY